MIIPVDLGEKSYPIIIQRGAIARIGVQVGTSRRVCVVSDSGVPRSHVDRVVESLQERSCEVLVHVMPEGEKNKTFDTFIALQRCMLDAGLTRRDAVVAVGGGVVGDVAGFAAATYMRGIDFYNVPTTVLSQVDSSVGGKTAVDLDGYKNMIGAFHQPRTVLIDPDVLLTLPVRQVANGLAEALKMGMTSDAALFSLLEELPPLSEATPEELLSEIIDDSMLDCLTKIIARAVTVKRDVVQADEKETGLRRVLNFGHTIGHAIESCVGLGDLYHGECVAMGIPPMCGEELRPRVIAAMQRLGLPTVPPSSLPDGQLVAVMKHDKKAEQGAVNAVRCDEIGTFAFERVMPEELVVRLHR